MAVVASELSVIEPAGIGSRSRSRSRSRADLLDCGVVRLARVTAGPPVRLPARTYRRRQAVAAGLVVGLALMAWALLGMLGGGALPVSERPSPSSVSIYVVRPGDTFWSIAARLKPNADPRPLVDRMVAVHGGSTLHVGERIPIPS